jgi:hypothetical protein
MDLFQHFPSDLMRPVLENGAPSLNLYWYHGWGAASKENSDIRLSLQPMRYTHSNLDPKRNAVAKLESFSFDDNLVKPRARMQQRVSKMSSKIALKAVARYT